MSAFPVSGNGTGLRTDILCIALQDHIPAQSAEAPKCDFPAHVKWLILYEEIMVQQVAKFSFLPGISILVHFFSSEETDKEGAFHPFFCASVTHSSSVAVSGCFKVRCGSPDATTSAHCAHMAIAAWDQAGSTSCFYLKMCKIPQTST